MKRRPVRKWQIIWKLQSNSLSQIEKKIESSVKELPEKLKKIEQLTDAMIDLMTDDDMVIAEKENEVEFEIQVRDIIASAQYVLESTTKVKNSGKGSVSQVKLPQLNLSKFDDTVIGWSAFWDRFANAVHNRSDLAPSEKFTYLLGLLQGDSLTLVERLRTDDESYPVAVNLLKKTYDNKVIGLLNQAEQILNLKVSSYNLGPIRKFWAEFESIVASLELLGCQVDGNSSTEILLLSLILTKLPRPLKERIMRAAGKDILQLSKFREAVMAELELLYSSESVKPKINTDKTNSGSNSTHTTVDKVEPIVQSTTSTFAVLTDKKKSKSSKYNKDPYCQFCKENGHPSKDCVKYPTHSSRMQKLREMGDRCKNCWLKSHGNQSCINLKCRICQGNHWTAICNKTNSDQAAAAINNICASSGGSVALPILSAPLIVGNYSYSVRCLLDQGAQRTLVHSSVVKMYSIPVVHRESLIIAGYGNSGEDKEYEIVHLRLKMQGSRSPLTIAAVVVEDLPQVTIRGIDSVAARLALENVSLADRKLKGSLVKDLEVLLGNDHYYDIVRTDLLPRRVNGVWLLPTWFGECITGSLPNVPGNSCSSNTVTVLKVGVDQSPWNDSMLPIEGDSIDKLWRLDNIGIVDEPHKTTDEEILKSFHDSIYFRDGHYTVRFPWKEFPPKLPNNFAMAKGRFTSLMRKLDKDPKLLKNYEDVLQDQLKRGFIEKVPEEEIMSSNTHYLPHHPIIRDHPTTPVRIVMDCSARVKGSPSLNDCLSVGPALVPLLLQIILRLRITRFIVAGDISKAFLRVGLNTMDRDYTRFFWRRDYQDPLSPIVAYRFKVVLFGSASSPFLLQATVQHHLTKMGLSELGRNLYVDNMHGTADTEQELVSFYHNSINCFNAAGLPLREWISNSPVLNEKISMDNNGVENPKTAKILGVHWDPEEDTLFLAAPNFAPPGEATKRSVLKDAGSVFDPLGLLTPVTILIRIFLQKLWSLKYDWDTQVSEALQSEWGLIVRKVNVTSKIRTPRWILKSKETSLHVFSDASKDVYGCCAYLVSEGRADLLMAKARVAPLKSLTIPKLELMAALIASRVTVFIIDTFKLELTFSSVHLWVDSQVALSWITSKVEQKNLFVRNRVKEINSNVPFACFHHIAGSDNPADIITKIGNKDLDGFDLWWHGPELLQDPSKWYVWESSGSIDVEVGLVVNNPTNQLDAPANEKAYNDSLPDPTRFSKWSKLLNATCYTLRFVNHLKKHNTYEEAISAAETNKAELLWIMELQGRWFSKEIAYLKDPTSFKSRKPPQLIANLWLVLQDNIIRVNTRLEFTSYSYSERYPILLPSGDYITSLIIQYTHERLIHASVSGTVVALRSRFWIPKCRQTVKSVISRCYACKRYRLQRYKIPHTPSLPPFRVEESRPFQFTGVDYTGALHVKIEDSVKKVYMVLFTCASTRAVHLDLAENASAYAFAKVYRRFVSRRSSPQLMLSDNATNFVGFVPQLKEFLESESLTSQLHNNRTTWKFIPTRAPWFGGMWERLIGVCKNVVKKALGKRLVTYDELLTVITEVEGRVNDRPLTYCTSNADDAIAVSPSQLLHGHKIDSLSFNVEGPELDLNYNFDSPSVINKRHRRILDVLKQTWDLWRKEYILALRERDRKKVPLNSKGDIIPRLGDICLLTDECNNSDFKLARIIRLIPGTDGEVRTAEVKTKGGSSIRPLAKLCHLESVDIPVPPDNAVALVKQPEGNLSLRPQRQTAMSALSKITSWAHGGLV